MISNINSPKCWDPWEGITAFSIRTHKAVTWWPSEEWVWVHQRSNAKRKQLILVFWFCGWSKPHPSPSAEDCLTSSWEVQVQAKCLRGWSILVREPSESSRGGSTEQPWTQTLHPSKPKNNWNLLSCFPWQASGGWMNILWTPLVDSRTPPLDQGS